MRTVITLLTVYVIALQGLLAAPAGLDGRSFVTLVDAPAAAHRDHAFHVYPRNELFGRAIRTDRDCLVEWKKIDADRSTADYELYDYQTDPVETRNLAADQPQVVAKLHKLLATHPEARRQGNATKSP